MRRRRRHPVADSHADADPHMHHSQPDSLSDSQPDPYADSYSESHPDRHATADPYLYPDPASGPQPHTVSLVASRTADGLAKPVGHH
jgi:hypothetical protein